MTLSAISHYRGGTVDEVAPLAKALNAIYLKHGIDYRLGRFQTGPNVGDWLVIVQYADAASYERARVIFDHDPEYQRIVRQIAKFATRISRELMDDLDL